MNNALKKIYAPDDMILIPPIDRKTAEVVAAAVRRELNYFGIVAELNKTEYQTTKAMLQAFWESLSRAIADSQQEENRE